jgi:hypothetical protein
MRTVNDRKLQFFLEMVTSSAKTVWLLTQMEKQQGGSAATCFNR